jgi:hypothetical protein
MEQPYRGRAILNKNYNGWEIIIPARKNWFLILFVGAWLCGWCCGEVVALTMIIGTMGKNPAGLFILVWLALWTIGGFFAFRLFIWNIMGKEVISIGQGQLTVAKKGMLFFKPKTYDLNEVRNIRAVEDNSGYGNPWGIRMTSFGGFTSSGTIRFDYGLQSVKFAFGLDEAEGRYILQGLRDNNLLTDKNYQ